MRAAPDRNAHQSEIMMKKRGVHDATTGAGRGASPGTPMGTVVRQLEPGCNMERSAMAALHAAYKMKVVCPQTRVLFCAVSFRGRTGPLDELSFDCPLEHPIPRRTPSLAGRHPAGANSDPTLDAARKALLVLKFGARRGIALPFGESLLGCLGARSGPRSSFHRWTEFSREDCRQRIRQEGRLF